MNRALHPRAVRPTAAELLTEAVRAVDLSRALRLLPRSDVSGRRMIRSELRRIARLHAAATVE
nr:hypothetical protein Hi04_10k_c2220_00026 [uncultured bacterium]